MDQQRRTGLALCRLAQNFLKDATINARQRMDVFDRRALVQFVHRRVGQAEIDYWAKLDQVAAVRGAATSG